MSRAAAIDIGLSSATQMGRPAAPNTLETAPQIKRNRIRYSRTVTWNLVLYEETWVLLGFDECSSGELLQLQVESKTFANGVSLCRSERIEFNIQW